MIDLHTHSNYSDGTLTPAQLVRLAKESGVSSVVLCDHNTIDGLTDFLEASGKEGIEGIPGVEFSADYGQTELHILGLWIQPEHYAAVSALLREAQMRKEESNRRLVAALAGAGISLDYDRIKAGKPGGLVNRAVIAAEMTRLGYTQSVKEAFSCWLAPKHGYFQPPRRLDCFEVIRFIRSIGAVSVLAHPFLNLEEGPLIEFLYKAVSAGLDAMETVYTKYDGDTARKAGEIARAFDLLESGGSDFHGENKPDTSIGTGRGNLVVPERFLTDLRRRREQNRAVLR